MEMHDVPVGKCRSQELTRVQMIAVTRSPGTVLQLTRGVALQHHMAAVIERLLHAREDQFAPFRGCELNEDTYDRVEALGHPCPIRYIGLEPLYVDAALSGQACRL